LLGLLCLLTLLVFSQFSQSSHWEISNAGFEGSWLLALLFILLPIIFAHICCCLHLPPRPDKLSMLDWCRQWMRVLLWVFIFALFAFLYCLPCLMILALIALPLKNNLGAMVWLAAPIGIASQLYIAFITARLMLVFPAVAAGQKEISIHWAWNLASGNGWRLALLVWLLPVLLNISACWLVNRVDLPNLILNYTVLLIQVLCFSLTVGSLTHSYVWLMAKQKDRADQQ
jgi:hypothetical protein